MYSCIHVYMYIHIQHAHLAVMLCIYFLYLYLSHPTLDYALLFFRNALLFFTLIRNWTFRVTYVNFFINGQRFVFSSMLSLVFFILAFISSIISRASYVDPTSAPAVIKHLHFEGFFSRSFLILSSLPILFLSLINFSNICIFPLLLLQSGPSSYTESCNHR